MNPAISPDLTTTIRYTFGPDVHDDGTVTFRVWAPLHEQLKLKLTKSSDTAKDDLPSDSLAMLRDEEGIFTLRVPARAGDRYWFELADGKLRPDPASRYQPDGVHGPSQVINTRNFSWKTRGWQGIPKHDIVMYELHVGTFTEQGTYDAAIQRLDELVELGVTAIELMPVVETAGNRNWGYDGVNFYAPRHSFGPPESLQRFVDEAHARGLAVFLDVVYNHFGPEGNYLHDFGGYVSQAHRTAWGDAPNFDEEGASKVRDFILGNVTYWIEEFQFDGLRLDAIHCIADHSKTHIVNEIGQLVDGLRRRLDREICLIAESNVYDPELLTQLNEEGHGFDAAWCDDFLHSVFAVLRPGEHMSSREYHPHSDLDIVLRRGFVYQGTLRATRQRIPLAPQAPAARLGSLVFAIQNHDFIGNHPNGLRLHQLTGHDAHRAAAALLLMHPSIPMLFMGEEYAAKSPFLFFADFGDDWLRTAVEEGRRREHPQHNWADSASPLDESAFLKSKIGPQTSGNPETLQWYKDLIRLRKQWRASGLLTPENLQAEWDEAASLARLTYRNGNHTGFVLIRLHSIHDDPQPLEFQMQHGLELSANCAFDQTREGSILRLDPFAVVIADTQA